ncbi:hypothetical protein GW17_00048127 [Ensete ventricosum]|nr:hypothetical protein GW17_00048127 [Ensete ventricosum]
MKHRLARTSMHVDLSSQQRCLVLKLKRLPSRTANTGIRCHSYLRSSMPLWLTMLSYFSTPSVVFTVTYVFYLLQLWRVDLILAKLAVQPLAPPYLCQVDFAVSGRPRLRSGAGQGCGDVTVRSIFVISFPPPPEKTFSRCSIRALKMRSCVKPWVLQ